MTKTEVINPITKDPMSKNMAKLVLQARQARRGAKKFARSGHPAKRAEGRKALRDIPNFIRALYVQDARSGK